MGGRCRFLEAQSIALKVLIFALGEEDELKDSKHETREAFDAK